VRPSGDPAPTAAAAFGALTLAREQVRFIAKLTPRIRRTRSRASLAGCATVTRLRRMAAVRLGIFPIVEADHLHIGPHPRARPEIADKGHEPVGIGEGIVAERHPRTLGPGLDLFPHWPAGTTIATTWRRCSTFSGNGPNRSTSSAPKASIWRSSPIVFWQTSDRMNASSLQYLRVMAETEERSPWRAWRRMRALDYTASGYPKHWGSSRGRGLITEGRDDRFIGSPVAHRLVRPLPARGAEAHSTEATERHAQR
jgi:hypothetical protein